MMVTPMGSQDDAWAENEDAANTAESHNLDIIQPESQHAAV